MILFLWMLPLPMTLNRTLSLQLQVSLVDLLHDFKSSTHMLSQCNLAFIVPHHHTGSRGSWLWPGESSKYKNNSEWQHYLGGEESKIHAWLSYIKTQGYIRIQRKHTSQHLSTFHELRRSALSYCRNLEAWDGSPMRLKLKEVIAVGSKDTASSLTIAPRTRVSWMDLGRREWCQSLRKHHRANECSSSGRYPPFVHPTLTLGGRHPLKLSFFPSHKNDDFFGKAMNEKDLNCQP